MVRVGRAAATSTMEIGDQPTRYQGSLENGPDDTSPERYHAPAARDASAAPQYAEHLRLSDGSGRAAVAKPPPQPQAVISLGSGDVVRRGLGSSWSPPFLRYLVRALPGPTNIEPLQISSTAAPSIVGSAPACCLDQPPARCAPSQPWSLDLSARLQALVGRVGGWGRGRRSVSTRPRVSRNTMTRNSSAGSHRPATMRGWSSRGQDNCPMAAGSLAATAMHGGEPVARCRAAGPDPPGSTPRRGRIHFAFCNGSSSGRGGGECHAPNYTRVRSDPQFLGPCAARRYRSPDPGRRYGGGGGVKRHLRRAPENRTNRAPGAPSSAAENRCGATSSTAPRRKAWRCLLQHLGLPVPTQ